MPISAGSRVTDATITTSTARLAETATPFMYSSPTRKRPSREMITVPPAMRTLRPAVVTASEIAASLLDPAASADRKRVRTSNA